MAGLVKGFRGGGGDGGSGNSGSKSVINTPTITMVGGT